MSTKKGSVFRLVSSYAIFCQAPIIIIVQRLGDAPRTVRRNEDWRRSRFRETPRRTTRRRGNGSTMTVNPIAAGLLAAQLVGEPITLNLIIGLVAVFARIGSLQ
jgi:hypothetical protein